VSAGWYVLLVELWPASDRPYIGGSTDNSLLQLALGYNGLSRIFGGRGERGAFPGPAGAPGMPPSGGGAPGTSGPSGSTHFSGFGGTAGIGRMFNVDFAGNISWLLPSALLLLVAGLWLTRRAPRTDRARAALVLFGGWLVVTGAVFSFMSGIIHPYYVVAMAPALAGVLAVGARELWSRRAHWAARATLAVAVLAAAGWSWFLLERTPEFLPWLRWVVLVAGVLGAAALALPARRLGRVGLVVAVTAGLVGSVGASTAYAIETVLTPHHGSIVSAGPAGQSGQGGPGGFGPGGADTSQRGGRAAGFRMGQPDGDAGKVDAALTALLRSAGTTWSAATVGANGAAGLELASGTSVIAIGGFSGSDPAPTLAQFQQWVTEGKVGYFVTSADGHRHGPGGDRGTAAEITNWVKAHYRATTIGDSLVYDLRAAR
jgi:4-amino-4-deoxy-L-arabinose transferase-like glycosyltransferase